MANHWALSLYRIGACNEAVRHCLKYKTPAQAWKAFSVENGEAEGWVLWLTQSLTGEADYFLRQQFERFTNGHVLLNLGPSLRGRADLRPYVPVPTLADLHARVRGDLPWILEEP